MPSKFQAHLFDELTNLYPDTDPAHGTKQYALSAADGTYPGVHLLLTGLEPGQFVTLEATGPNQNYKFFEILPVPVEVNSSIHNRTEWRDAPTKDGHQNINPFVPRRAPYMVYDALRPLSNVVTAQGSVMALAFRCKAIAPTEYAAQEWTLTLQQKDQIQRLTVLLEVYPETVGEVTKDDHKLVNWFSAESMEFQWKAPIFSQRWYQLYEEYYRIAKYGRQNIMDLPASLYFEVDGDNVTLNENKLDKFVAIADKLGYYWLEGGHWAGRKDGEWEATQGETFFTKKPLEEGGMEELHHVAKQLNAYLEKHALKERWIQSFWDEPLDVFATVYVDAITELRESIPGVPFLDATIATESIVGALDYWCPTVDEYERHKEFFDQRVEQGEKIFTYTCLTPVGNYCNRLLDMERIRAVYLGWGPAKYENIIGFLHWGGNYGTAGDSYYLMMPTNHVTDYAPFVRPTVLPAGDNMIVYPDHASGLPIPSVRLEAQRMGLEDQVLLLRLKEKDPALAKAIIAKLFRGYSDYTKDIKTYRKVKRELLEALSPGPYSPKPMP